MFKCRECGQEYNIKPDYCDCGNDTFVEIISTPIFTKQNLTTTEPLSSKTKMNLTTFLARRNITILGLSIFVGCLALSIIVLIFCFNFEPKQSTINTKKINKQKLENIPNIENLWVENQKQNLVKQEIIPQTIIQKNTNKTKQTGLNSSKSKTNVLNNQSTKTKTTSNTQKTQPKTTKKQITEKSTTIEKKQIEIPKQPKQTTKTVKPPTVVEKKASPTNSVELNNYKIALRNALFSKLSVVSINGRGKCGIEFSINPSGKLINRNFTYQSDNESVNDEVYKMLMRLPSFYPPPEGYKGEKIKMTFSFDNGNYVINYTN